MRLVAAFNPRLLVAIALASFMYLGAEMTLGTWLPKFQVDVFGASDALAGLSVTFYFVGQIVGRLAVYPRDSAVPGLVTVGGLRDRDGGVHCRGGGIAQSGRVARAHVLRWSRLLRQLLPDRELLKQVPSLACRSGLFRLSACGWCGSHGLPVSDRSRCGRRGLPGGDRDRSHSCSGHGASRACSSQGLGRRRRIVKAIVKIAYTSPTCCGQVGIASVMYVEEKPRSWPK